MPGSGLRSWEKRDTLQVGWAKGPWAAGRGASGMPCGFSPLRVISLDPITTF